MADVRVVPLWQPWASLVVLGKKSIETRPMPAPRTIIGARVGIHATLKKDELWLANREPFARALDDVDELPLGALIGTVFVVESKPITRSFAADLQRHDPDEYAFGNYAVGRHAWILRARARRAAQAGAVEGQAGHHARPGGGPRARAARRPRGAAVTWWIVSEHGPGQDAAFGVGQAVVLEADTEHDAATDGVRMLWDDRMDMASGDDVTPISDVFVLEVTGGRRWRATIGAEPVPDKFQCCGGMPADPCGTSDQHSGICESYEGRDSAA